MTPKPPFFRSTIRHQRRRWLLLLGIVVLTAWFGAGIWVSSTRPTPLITDTIAALLENRSSGTTTITGWRSFDACEGNMTICPAHREVRDCPWLQPQDVMTDESIPAYLSTLGQTTHNQRLETRFTDVPWVLLVSAIDLPPNRARLRGHLDDPAYAQCPYAERIFVVEAVVEAFADTPLVIYSHRGDPILPPPPSVATWPVYTDALLGFHLPIPPGATVVSISATDTLLGGIELSFASGDPIRVRVWDEALFQDPQAPDYRSAVITRYPGEPWTQNSLPVRPQTDDPPLVGYLQMYPFDRPHQHQLYRVLFGANDRTYTVEFVATLGAEADQVRHLTYGYLVGFFGLTAPQGPTPTVPPPMFSTAPFLSAEVAWGEFQAVESPKNTAGLPLTYEAAWLLTEAAYRKWNADAGIRTCAVFEGHAAGIWLYQGVVVHPTDGLYLQATALDAQTAKVVCSSSLSSEAIALLPPPNP